MEVLACKVASVQADITNIVTVLLQGTVRLSDSVRREAGEALIKISKRLMKAFYCKARSLQQRARDADRGTTEEPWGLFANVASGADKRLGIIFGRAARTDESDRPGSFFVAHCELGYTSGCVRKSVKLWSRFAERVPSGCNA